MDQEDLLLVVGAGAEGLQRLLEVGVGVEGLLLRLRSQEVAVEVVLQNRRKVVAVAVLQNRSLHLYSRPHSKYFLLSNLSSQIKHCTCDCIPVVLTSIRC